MGLKKALRRGREPGSSNDDSSETTVLLILGRELAKYDETDGC
jgi:hypothetical protein